MNVPRRSFLKLLFFGLNGLLALCLSVPVLGYILGPLFARRVSQWVQAGHAKDFTAAEPKPVRLRYISTTGYREVNKSRTVWIHTEADQVIAYSSECPHVGCNVIWKQGRDVFICPCHGGEFDKGGNVLAGPPPRPLSRLATKVEEGMLFVEV